MEEQTSRVYFSYTMTDRQFLTEEYQRLKRFAKALEKEGYEVFVPPPESVEDPDEIFVRDWHNLARADLFVCFVGKKLKSYGVGAELAVVALHGGVPVIMVCEEDWATLSSFIRGMLSQCRTMTAILREPLSRGTLVTAAKLLCPHWAQKKPAGAWGLAGLLGEEE